MQPPNQQQQDLIAEPMYKHLLINSLFNSIFCLIMLLKLINTCIFENGSIFCSTVYQANEAQYFKIILIIYGGTVLKLCCNVSYIYFALSRLVLVAKLSEKFNILKKFSLIRKCLYLPCLLIFSCLLNVYNLFQYKLNTELDERFEFPFEKRNEDSCEYDPYECNVFDSF